VENPNATRQLNGGVAAQTDKLGAAAVSLSDNSPFLSGHVTTVNVSLKDVSYRVRCEWSCSVASADGETVVRRSSARNRDGVHANH
jgi:hypothetical protein